MRRTLILGGAAAFAALILPSTSHASQARRITLRHQHTGARFSGIWHDGEAPDPVAMQELSEVLADAGATPVRPFNADALDIVWQIAAATNLDSELDIHSGYRTPRINRAVHGAGDSQHLRASAMDVGVPWRRLSAVSDAARKLSRGGVGIYRSFVHLDSGPVRYWGGGSGRAGSMQPTVSRLDNIAEAWRGAAASRR